MYFCINFLKFEPTGKVMFQKILRETFQKFFTQTMDCIKFTSDVGVHPIPRLNRILIENIINQFLEMT